MTTPKRTTNLLAEEPKIADENFFPEDRPQQILIRPDGYYWQAPDGNQEFGPFETVELAQADMALGYEETGPLVGETLQEAEDEIGIADWIDPETGQPAEGQSRPHLEAE